MPKTYAYFVVYSPHDGGYYGEVSIASSGQEVYVTPILPTSGSVVMHIKAKYPKDKLIRLAGDVKS